MNKFVYYHDYVNSLGCMKNVANINYLPNIYQVKKYCDEEEVNTYALVNVYSVILYVLVSSLILY